MAIMRYMICLLLMFLNSILVMALPISEKQVRQALSRLDVELEQRDKYIENHQARIDSLRVVLDGEKNDKRERLDLMMALADEYVAFNADSALYYFAQGYEKSQEMGCDSLAMVFRLHRATYLPLVGFVMEAVGEYEAISRTEMPEALKSLYYDSGRQMYSYISSFYDKYPAVSKHWSGLAFELQKDLLSSLEDTDLKYKLNLGEFYFISGEYGKARAVLEDLLAQIPDDTNMYARASYMLSSIADERGNKEEQVYYLTLSAIADVKSATLEVMSLQELGGYMFECGDVERAHSYLSVALDYAVKCNAMMRMVQSSQAMPIIADTHEVERSQWRDRIYAFIVVLALLLVVVIVALFFLRREMRRMAVLQSNLQNANHTKDVYITQFLNLCSIYMDKLNQFSKVVNRKIAAGKVDDLFRMTKSGKFVEEQSKEFYEVFDNAFLHIYPTFVDEVNVLLRSDEQIVLGESELLNTDLRILAFMRLGIEESTRIAQVLNYSVNTIYTYRNKLKNKAINRDDFEKNIMKIKSVS